VRSVEAPIRDAAGHELGALRVSTLPSRRDHLERDGDLISVEEDATYVFRIDGTDQVVLEPGRELFSFDDDSQTRGRLQPRQHVGRIRVAVRGSQREGAVAITVRPRKLDAETEFRQMLDEIAEVATEAILQGFAPPAVALEHDAATRPELLYQQFAFLHARLMASGERDLALVLHRPHRAWVGEEEHRPPGAPFRGGSGNVRALARPGPRVPAPAGGPIASLPTRVSVMRTEETLDTEANRFVLFALERWREIAQRVLDVLTAQSRGAGPISRGIDAATAVIELIDRTRSAPMFREVGRLRSFPSGNQVLQKRAGYRELLRTFVLTEVGARLALNWEVEDVFGASQRNVATLYEYWAFLQLARSVGRVCGTDLTLSALELSSDDMSMAFRRGAGTGLRWTTAARGRTMQVELYFNREFLATAVPDASWSRAMRPDCSICVRPDDSTGEVSADDLTVWLHFDAKYRVEFAAEEFSSPPPNDAECAAESEKVERLSRSKREDLLKMHAYRDAIRRSAGAYVLYPGDEQRAPFTEYHEVLPGIGAFALRPGADGAKGVTDLERFLANAIDHLADRATQHERDRFWSTIIHRPVPIPHERDRRLPQLPVPPSDAIVLCGYVKNARHEAWIKERGMYNVRAGDRRGAVAADAEILRAPDLVLYGSATVPSLWARRGPWFVQSSEELRRIGYPQPRGRVYLCCPVERHSGEPEWLPLLDLPSVGLGGAAFGEPFAVTWLELLEAAG
jgi:predicted component of viral defense system (DUF524 family)